MSDDHDRPTPTLIALVRGDPCPEADKIAELGVRSEHPMAHDLFRLAYLESELARIRPVYEAACRWMDAPPSADVNTALAGAVDRARTTR